MSHPLRNTGFEWHDLPVERLSLSAAGIELMLRPFDGELQSFDGYVLQLADAESISFSVSGRLTSSDLEGLEISTFSFDDAGLDRISGKLGLISGSPAAGYWELGFSGARWCLFKHNHSFNPDALKRAG